MADAAGLPAVALEVARQVQAGGAVTLRKIVLLDQVGELRSALISAHAEDAERYGDSHPFPGIVHALMARNAVFIRILETPAILAVSRAILGNGCIVHAFNSSMLPAGADNFSSRIHVDSPRLVPGYITNIGFILALDRFTERNGAMEIAPSLVDRAAPPPEEEFEASKIVLDHLEPGDAVCFNVRCWHRGGVNRTERDRLAVTLNICRSYMRQQFDYPAMLGEVCMAGLSPDLQQFLGYYVRMPKSMTEFLLPPEQRPYRPGQE